MKVEIREHAIVLRPETKHEQQALSRLHTSGGVEKVMYEDEWERRGGLILKLRQHPFDKK